MSQATARPHDLTSAFERVRRDLPGLETERAAALARFRTLGVPTAAHPAWKGTDPSGLLRQAFEPATGQARLSAADVDRLTFADHGAARLVYVDGLPAPALSSALPKGVRAGTVEKAAGRFAKLADWNDSAFAALNLAYFRGAAIVEIDPGAVVDRPLHVVHLTATANAAVHPRTHLLVGEGAEATVVESYASPAGLAAFTNAVTEIEIGAAANLRHVRLQRESEEAWHVATTQVAQGRDSTYRAVAVDLGARLSRHELDARFEGPGGNGELFGLFLPAGQQHHDVHTWLDHAQPHCASREVFKGVLDGAARGVFHGRIVVRPGAQKTDAKQSNKNLLLSRQALVDSTPQLEIYADDVKCTHGSTTGQLEEEQMFYLRSRGVPQEEARGILVHAFAREVVERIPVPALRERVEGWIGERLDARGGL